ncbi:hypothetical protein EMCRGX_G026784 [Ephydatia muelleri]
MEKDADSTGNGSATAQGKKRSIQDDDCRSATPDGDYFPAGRLFEYQWPVGDDTAEHYMLQEQVAEFLDIRGIQRKYPDLERRTLDVEERKYLVGRGVVSETFSNMGLVALCSDQVLELMAADYPRKYQEYMDVLEEREFQTALKKKILETRSMAGAWHVSEGKSNQHSILRDALQRTVEYNSNILEQRRQRCVYLDTQTRILQFTRKPLVLQPCPTRKYPVALLPGQYADWYPRYTPQDLQCLPLKTVTSLSVSVPQQQTASVHTGAANTTTVGTALTSLMDRGTSTQQTLPAASSAQYTTNVHSPTGVSRPAQPKRLGLKVACSVCYKGRASNQREEPEDLLYCITCHSHTHPSCLNLTPKVATIAKTYPWQCLECKMCQVCGDGGQEESMVFCDECDRGYHSFCVNLNGIPSGLWLCRVCGSCANCGSKSPGSEVGSKWKHEYHGNKFFRTLCMQCSRQYRSGHFCPLCVKTLGTSEAALRCSSCTRRVHTACDAKGSVMSPVYQCSICRGEWEKDGPFRNRP